MYFIRKIVILFFLILGHGALQSSPFQVEVLRKGTKTVIIYYDHHDLGSDEESSQMFCGLCRRLSLLNLRGEHVRLLVEGPLNIDSKLYLAANSFNQLPELIQANQLKLSFLNGFNWLQSNQNLVTPNIDLVDIELPSRCLFTKVFKFLARIQIAEEIYCNLNKFFEENPQGGDVLEILSEFPYFPGTLKNMILDWVVTKQGFQSEKLFTDEEKALIPHLSFVSVLNWGIMDDILKNLNTVFDAQFVKDFIHYLNRTNSMEVDINQFVQDALRNCRSECFRNEFFVRFCLERVQTLVERIREWQSVVTDCMDKLNRELAAVSRVSFLDSIIGVFDIAEILHDQLYSREGREFNVADNIKDFIFNAPDASMTRLVDLNVMVKILGSSSTKDVLFIGGVHANEIVNALINLGFERTNGILASNTAGVEYQTFREARYDHANIRMLPESCFDFIL